MRNRPTRTPEAIELQWVWWGALGCFALAGLTGAFFRFGLIYGYSAGLDLAHIRHAHSHLMYFGWVTPALMASIVARLPGITGRSYPSSFRSVMVATFAAALLAYPLFALFGYTPVAFGTKRIPPAVIAAGLNVVAWYAFVVMYVRTTRGVSRTRVILLWDMAVIFMVLATLGAWGLALLKPLGVESVVWSTALTHIFLDYFSEGWFVLGVLGLAYATLNAVDHPPGHWSLWLLVAGIPVTFALGMPRTLVPAPLEVVARAAAVMVAVGLLGQVWVLWRSVPGRRVWMWAVPLGFLATKAVVQGAAGLVPGVWWAAEHGLRILYLHLMLLGFVTLGLVAAAASTWGRHAVRGPFTMYLAVVLLLLSLLPLTALWPAAWQGAGAHTVAAWAALLPVLAAMSMLARGLLQRRRVTTAG